MRKTILWHRSALSVLGLDDNIQHSEEDVKAAFRRQAKLLHPDAGGSSEKFCELHAAYGLLRGGIKSSSLNSHEERDESSFYNNSHSYWSTNHYSESGLGSAFARGNSSFTSSSSYNDNNTSSSRDFGVEWEAKKYPNNSTRDFYRPYTSNPFSHGFTAEEIREAEQQRRILIARWLLKHFLLWGGLLYLIYVYLCENRITRAIKAREDGYTDVSYWAQLEEDARRGFNRGVHSHWINIQNEEIVRGFNRGVEKRRRKEENMQSLVGGSFLYFNRPVALSFKGRPFTVSGVRGGRSGVVKSSETFINDEHWEIDDVEEE